MNQHGWITQTLEWKKLDPKEYILHGSAYLKHREKTGKTIMFGNAYLTDNIIKEGKEMISIKMKTGVPFGMGSSMG